MAPTDFKTFIKCFKNSTSVEQIYESMAKLKHRKDGTNSRHILFLFKHKIIETWINVLILL